MPNTVASGWGVCDSLAQNGQKKKRAKMIRTIALNVLGCLALLACTIEDSPSDNSAKGNTEWRTLQPSVSPDLLRIARHHCIHASPTYEDSLEESPKFAIYYPHVKSWLTGTAGGAERRCLDNALRFLGAADPQRAASDLRFFVESWIHVSVDESSPASFLKLAPASSALYAMSIALRSGKLSSSQANFLFNYLADSADPTKWSARTLSWTWADERSRRSALGMMAWSALDAIALSGHPESREIGRAHV